MEERTQTLISRIDSDEAAMTSIVNKSGILTVNSMTASIVMTGCQDDEETESSSDEDQETRDTNSSSDTTSKEAVTKPEDDHIGKCNEKSSGSLHNGTSTKTEVQLKESSTTGQETGRGRKLPLSRTRSRPVSNEDSHLAQSVIIGRESINDRKNEQNGNTISNPVDGSNNGDNIIPAMSGSNGNVTPKKRLLSDGEVHVAVHNNLRFNPFNKESVDNDDADSISFTSDMSRKTSTSGYSEIDDEVLILDDHFSLPEGHLSEKSIPDLKLSIQRVKDMIVNIHEKTPDRKQLVKKLVHLRMKLAALQEDSTEDNNAIKPILGHKFIQRDSRSSKHYCEKCNTVIWGMIQTWYRCSNCGYTSHSKCLNQTLRPCASVKVEENPTYVKYVCPETCLSSQKYKCQECRTPISFQEGFSEPRLCDYSGFWYCEQCHWNDSMVIPARVLHNWDFEPRKVCRASKQFLRLMTKKAVLHVQEFNPMLFSFVEELNKIKNLREEILFMKKYFLSCKSALESKLLLQLQNRQHFVDNSNMYCLQDLCDTESGSLLTELTIIHGSFARHITQDCQLCQVKGFVCELCNSREVLFPFLSSAEVCQHCQTVLHRRCLAKKNYQCPKCQRKESRRIVNQ